MGQKTGQGEGFKLNQRKSFLARELSFPGFLHLKQTKGYGCPSCKDVYGIIF